MYLNQANGRLAVCLTELRLFGHLCLMDDVA